jgi:hypothetical protein
MGSGGGAGGGSSGDSTTFTRYASYIEENHQRDIGLSRTIKDDILYESPYDDYGNLSFDSAIYGVGNTMRNFFSLHEQFRTLVGGINLDDLWDDTIVKVTGTDTVNDLVEAHSDLLDEEIEEKSLPRFNAGMRDINSVMSSTFVIGRSIIERGKVKAVSEYAAKLKFNLFSVSMSIFSEKLRWNKDAYMMYSDIVKISSAIKIDELKINYEFLVKHKLWPFTVLKNDMAIVGALNGAMNQVTHNDARTDTDSSIKGAVGGALSGAAAGFMTGNPIMGAIGGAAGLLSGLL